MLAMATATTVAIQSDSLLFTHLLPGEWYLGHSILDDDGGGPTTLFYLYCMQSEICYLCRLHHFQFPFV